MSSSNDRYIYTQLLDNFFRNLKSFPDDRSREKSESNTVGLFDSRFIRHVSSRVCGEGRWISYLCPWHKLNPSHGRVEHEDCSCRKVAARVNGTICDSTLADFEEDERSFLVERWPLCANFYCERLHGTRHLRMKRSTTGTSTVCVWPG